MTDPIARTEARHERATANAGVRRLDAVSDAQIDQLATLLIDCVDGGASVSFMHPLSRDKATAFWRRAHH